MLGVNARVRTVIGPGRLNLPFLEQVAAEYVREPVIVRLEPFQRTLGIAYRQEGTLHIDLAESLGVGDLTPVFWHEIGHLVCGHVKHDTTEFPGDIPEYEKEIAERMAMWWREVYPLKAEELEAWTFAINARRDWERKNGFFAKAAYSLAR